MPSYETDFFIQSQELPPQSARGCIQTLSLLEKGHFYRTINGRLLYSGTPVHKYYTKIECRDKNSPGLEGLERGQSALMGCLVRWNHTLPDSQESVLLSRWPVDGSVIAYDQDFHVLPCIVQERFVSVSRPKEKEGPVFVSYRPLLSVLVQSYTLQSEEWGKGIRWSLEALEV